MRYKTPVAEGTPDRLVAAAIRVWAANPSAPLEAVALEAQVGRATLHRHFPQRADLLRAAAVSGIAALDASLSAAFGAGPATSATAAHARLRTLCDVLVRSGDRLHFTLVAGELVGDAEVTAAEAAIDARLTTLLDEAVTAGVLRADVPPAWRFRAIEALVYAAWTGVAHGELAANDAAALVHATLLRGLGA